MILASKAQRMKRTYVDLSDKRWIARLLNVVDVYHVVPMNGMSLDKTESKRI